MRGQPRAPLRLWDGPNGIYALLWTAAALWGSGIAIIGTAHAILGALVLVVCALGAWWWHRTRLTWAERAIVRRWERACQTARIANVPTIRRKRNGRLDARTSIGSTTLQVEVHRPDVLPHHVQDDTEKKWTIVKSLEQLAGLAPELKMALAGDVAQVRVHPRKGNHASVVITDAIEGARRVLVQNAEGKVVEIAVTVDQGNRAWLYNAELGGWVLAQHRYAVEYHPVDGDDSWQAELDDDEEAAWWVNDLPDGDDDRGEDPMTDAEYDALLAAWWPQPSAPIGPPRSPEMESDREKSGCFRSGGRGVLDTPPAEQFDPPTGSRILAPWLVTPGSPIEPVSHGYDVAR